ncbi:hypothetical protein [Flavobacterium fluvii]|uniref:hypothetical protein n=1 Tax=Flavobacterium fluvii TaxID=468056 RepID=UPI00147B4388|nr:hypothetical protein [Flavobacterium fluvii]
MSSIDNPGGGGGFFAVGGGGPPPGAAKALTTPRRATIKIKNLHTIVFIIIEEITK